VVITVFNNLDKQIIPGEITLTDVNTASVDLNAFRTLTGTWHAGAYLGGSGSGGGISSIII
jgi:hypothetical protein